MVDGLALSCILCSVITSVQAWLFVATHNPYGKVQLNIDAPRLIGVSNGNAKTMRVESIVTLGFQHQLHLFNYLQNTSPIEIKVSQCHYYTADAMIERNNVIWCISFSLFTWNPTKYSHSNASGVQQKISRFIYLIISHFPPIWYRGCYSKIKGIFISFSNFDRQPLRSNSHWWCKQCYYVTGSRSKWCKCIPTIQMAHHYASNGNIFHVTGPLWEESTNISAGHDYSYYHYRYHDHYYQQ